MSQDELKVSVTVRIPVSMVQMLDVLVKEKKYSDRSEAIRTLIHDGIYLAKIIQVVKDPKKVKGIVKKLRDINTLQDIEQTMETMPPHQLQLVQSIAKEIRDKKVEQTLLDMKE